MKVLFLISLFTCTVLAFPKEDGCTFCREGVQKLMDLALDTEAQQEYLLVYGACQDFDQMGCQLGVIRYWSKIAKVLYQTPEFVEDICGELSCNVAKEWNCEVCRSDLRAVSEVVNGETLVRKAIEKLETESFCNDDDTCKEYIRAFVPKAIATLSEHLKFNTIGVCKDVFQINCD